MKKRIAAEWEPAVGVMVAWPPVVPHKLIVEYAHDTQLHLLVADDAAESDARTTLQKWGVDPDTVKYLHVPQGEDYAWPRDWGPQPLFREDGSFALLSPSYVLSTPFCDIGHDVELLCADEVRRPLSDYDGDTTDDTADEVIAQQLGVDCIKLSFAFTGGNVLGDGVNSLFSTEVLTFENRYKGFEDKQFFSQVADITGMTNYSIFSDYEEFSLNHIDCLAKPLDDRRIMVLRYPKDHPHYQMVEDIAYKEIGRALNSYGEPWEIVRIDTNYIHREGMVAAYANSLILNKCVYVPLYSIPQDEIALQQWQELMPGYTIKGFTFVLDEEPDTQDFRGLYDYIGWDPGDVLHCRSRAIWDTQMLYVQASRPFGKVGADEPYTVHAHIVAYSGQALVEDMPSLNYRVDGGQWTRVVMQPSSTRETYLAEIPGQTTGVKIEYYVEAADGSGRHECCPRVAPEGCYSYTVA